MLFDIPWNLSSNWAFAWSILPILLIGLEVTIKATVCGFLLALILGLPLALLRAVPYRIVSWPTAVLIEFIRDTPLLVQVYFVYYVLPDYGLIFSAFLTEPSRWVSSIALIPPKYIAPAWRRSPKGSGKRPKH